jgi:hypothetical protein
MFGRRIMVRRRDRKGFEEARYRLLPLCLERGLRLVQRPAGIKASEAGATLLPDMRFDPQSGLRVGQLIDDFFGYLVPWGLQAAENHPVKPDYRGQWISREVYLLCFVRVPFIGKCPVEGMYAVLARTPREPTKSPQHFTTDVGLWGDGDFRDVDREKGPSKVLLYPASALRARKSRKR